VGLMSFVSTISLALRSRNFPYDNVERLSLGGAAHEPLREGTQVGDRAGERKTGWAKPLPPPPGLWALNGP